MRRALLLSLVLLLGLTACGDDGAEEPTPSPTASPTSTGEPTEPEASQEVTAWFVRITETDFWVEPQTVLRPPTEGVARAAMDYLFSRQPDHPDLSTSVPAGVEVRDVTREDDVIVVDVSADIDPPGTGHGSMEEAAFAAQLSYTAAQFDGVRGARLLVEGEPIEDLWGHFDWSGVMEPPEFKETPITIVSPAWGETVESGPVTASGEANTFEATLAVRLIGPDGAVVEEEWIMATSGSGTRGTWEHTFDAEADEPGTWVIEAEEPDPSGGAEGRTPLVVRSEFTVA